MSAIQPDPNRGQRVRPAEAEKSKVARMAPPVASPTEYFVGGLLVLAIGLAVGLALGVSS